MKNTLIHLSSSPYSNLSCKEGLDLALVLATFEQAVDLCLSGAALSILGTHQDPEAEQGKNLHKLLEGLAFYDIENIFIQERYFNSDADQAWHGTQALNETEWSEMFSKYLQVFRF